MRRGLWSGGKACLGILLAWVSLLGAAQAASAANVLYNGGPVSHSMTGVLVDWGSSVDSVYTDSSAGDPGLIKYLAAASGSTSDIGGVLAQYMDSSSRNAANQDSYGGQYEISPSVTATTIYDSQISAELVSQIQAGNLPYPAGDGLTTIYLVLFPAGDTECIDSQTCSGSYFCAYHSSTALPDGTNVLYAVLPDNTSGPMSQGCGTAPTQFADQTSYLSHEWSETITDPLGNAWWDSSSGGTGNEVGDWCNQYMAQSGSWTVQEEWSNLDNNCESSEPAYSAPAASFTAPSSTSLGQGILFDASSSSDPSQNNASAAFSGTSYSISSGIASYSWNWGDGTSDTTSAAATATHAFASSGTYQVSLTVTDDLGFTSTVTHSVSVSSSTGTSPSATTDGASGIDDQGATLAGEVDPAGQPVTYRFDYGTSASSLTQSTPVAPGPTGATAQSVSATLSGLQPSTTYYYQLVVLVGGQGYTGGVQSFTTNAAPPPPQAPTVSSGPAAQLTTSSALLTGMVNPGGPEAVGYWFAYGTSPSNLTQSTSQATQPGGTTAIPVTTTISGLEPGATYYYALEASLNGTTYVGQVSSFTTQAPAPSITTGGASHLTSQGATVSGSVDPHGMSTTYYVEFGPTTAYGYSSPPVEAGPGSGQASVSVLLSGLRPQTTYHYRLVASSAGGSAVGGDATFTTPRAPGTAPRFGFHAPRRVRLRAMRSRRLSLRFECSAACTVHFVVTASSRSMVRMGSVPLTVARGTGALRRAGSGIGRLRFIRSVVARLLRHHRGLHLVISAYAVGSGSGPSPPQSRVVSVR